MSHFRGLHVCCFSMGYFDVKSPSGKQGILFDESEQFGPSYVHPRTEELSMIPERVKWFWDGYHSWRKAGRPTTGKRSTPIGDIWLADFSQLGGVQ